MIRSRCASRLFSVWLQSNARPRYFTSISGRSSPANLLGGASGFLAGGGGSASVSGADSQVRALAALLRMPVRNLSAETVKKGEEEEEEEKKKSVDGDAKGIVSYWGIAPRKLVKPDGTEWKWTCFMPWDTYRSDTSIDLKKHHVPETFVDKVAYWTVKSLRWPSDLFFRKRYGCRAILLETIAAVPGMVGGMLLHFKSVRRFEHSGGWVKALLEEAENERMHLMTFMEVTKPKWYERALVISAQGVFCTAYFAAYVLSPKLAHRIVGYLEEEAIYSYTEFLNELDKGRIENIHAPAIAIDYWQLPQDATLRDVVVVVRADEAHHRDVNHFASDIHHQGLQLKETPAPVGYH